MNDVNKETSKWVVSLILSCAILYTILRFLPGCGSAPGQEETITVIRPARRVSPHCSEMASEMEHMRAGCNSTMVAPSRAREACRTVEVYERECL